MSSQVRSWLSGSSCPDTFAIVLNHRAEYLQADFDKAAEEAKTLPDKTTNDDKLILYGLFKQATVGDCNTCRIASQSLFDVVRMRALTF